MPRERPTSVVGEEPVMDEFSKIHIPMYYDKNLRGATLTAEIVKHALEGRHDLPSVVIADYWGFKKLHYLGVAASLAQGGCLVTTLPYIPRGMMCFLYSDQSQVYLRGYSTNE